MSDLREMKEEPRPERGSIIGRLTGEGLKTRANLHMPLLAQLSGALGIGGKAGILKPL